MNGLWIGKGNEVRMQEELRRQRKKALLDFVKDEHYRPMKIKELANLFGVPKKERGELHEIVDSLVRHGKIIVDARGFIRIPEENIVTGSFMATRRGFGFVRTEDGKEDIFIPEPDCMNAFHGDTVQAVLTSPEKMGKRREGAVIRILQRNCTEAVGTFTKNKNVTFVIPDSEKILKDIYIPKGKTLDAADGQKVVARIEDFGDEERNPEGKIVQILGYIGEPGVDILSIVKSFGIPEEFPEEVMRQLDKVPDCVENSQIGGRVDIRNLPTVTIDGEDAKDLDDAITIEKKQDGSYELGVHIADVSHYVTEESALDREALARGTSVYLADRVIPMLPYKLSNGICSLNAGTDRLALSCFMTFDARGQLKNHRIAESVICVTERMSYTDVNDILTYHKPETCEKYKTLVTMFETMEELAALLRKRRKKKGAVDFDFTECKIKMDEKGHPVDIVPYDRNVATNIIEEFMLAANQTVAEEYFWMDIPFLFRTHEYPDLEKIHELARVTANFGYHMVVGNEEVHPGEIQKLLDKIHGTEEEAFLSRLTLRAMKRAKYSTVNEGHFGLATQYYCHFTSPIRRYPDLQIHRIIKENLRYGIREKRILHYEQILERRADDAEREVEKLKKAEYMEKHIGEIFTGIVSGVTSWGIYVELPNTVEGMVRLTDLDDDQYTYEEEKYRVIGHYSGKEYSMGQKVKIRVERVDKFARTIDFIMIDEEGIEDGERADQTDCEQ
jgi:ribonuclease R